MGRPVCGGSAYARRADARGDRPADERGHRADGPPGPLRSLLHGIALMGGAAVGGNRTPCSEFNIHADPDAAEIVFSSGIPIVMCGLDVTGRPGSPPSSPPCGHAHRALACGDGRTHAKKHGPRRRAACA